MTGPARRALRVAAHLHPQHTPMEAAGMELAQAHSLLSALAPLLNSLRSSPRQRVPRRVWKASRDR